MTTLYNGSSTSAGVYAGEEDNSFSPQQTNPTIGAMVGPSRRGPLNKPTFTSSVNNWRRYFGRFDPSLTFAHLCAEQFLKQASALWFVRVARNAKYGWVAVHSENGFAQIKPALVGYSEPEDHNPIPEEILYIHAADPGKWNDNVRVVLYPDVDDPTEELFVLEVYEGNYSVPVEVYRGTLRDVQDGYGRQLNISQQLEDAESRIRAVVNEDHPAFVASEGKTRSINAVIVGDLRHGDDGDPVNTSDIINAWEYFEEPEDIEVTLLINGGYTDPSVHRKMLDIAADRRDCFAILDVPSNMQTAQKAVNYRRNVLNANTSFGALYTSDIKVTHEGKKIWVPASGAVAARYAYNDNVAAEWWAPAGVQRGVIEGAEALREEYDLGARNMLDQNQVNFLHNINGYGITIWAAQTLQAEKSALQDVPVRRLICSVEKKIKYRTLAGVFEPNDPFLWKELKGFAEKVLEPVKNGRGVYAYAVKCDEETNPPHQIANGDVVLVYYVQPTRYGKRILFTTSVAKTGEISTAVEYVTATA